jgi:hypothetical protein
MWQTVKRSAKLSGTEFSLALSDLVIPTHCPIFGMELKTGPGPREDASPTVDRMDNTKGYVKGNVWVISWKANRLKSDATLADLEQLVRGLSSLIAC